jgi:hypothetical protein
VHSRRDTYTFDEKLERDSPVGAPINEFIYWWDATISDHGKGFSKKLMVLR